MRLLESFRDSFDPRPEDASRLIENPRWVRVDIVVVGVRVLGVGRVCFGRVCFGACAGIL